MSKFLAVMFIYLSLCASVHFVEARSKTWSEALSKIWSETLRKTMARSGVAYVGSMICGPLCGVGGKPTTCYKLILRYCSLRLNIRIISTSQGTFYKYTVGYINKLVF